MPILNGTLSLGPHVPDAEDLATRILRKWADKTFKHQLNPDEHEDALAYIIAAAWRSHSRYQAKNKPFTRQLASTVLWTACIDWIRDEHGRTTWKFATHTHHRNLPTTAHLTDDDRDSRLASTLTSSEMDTPEHRDPTLARVLTEAARIPSWETAKMDQPTPDRTPKRTRTAA